jgi:hypothetical protein
MDASTRPPVWKRITGRHLLLAILIYFLFISVLYALKAEGSKSAILRWRTQLIEMSEGADIYDKYAYPNPPIMALILTPIVTWTDQVGLPPLVAGLGWFWLKVGMTLLSLVWVFRMIETSERPFPLWAKTLTVLLSLRAITGDLQHGNVNIFILFLVIAGLYAWHRGRDFLGGAVLALAMACKVTPALFVPYLIWKRAWSALAGCAVGLLLFFWPGVVPAMFLGWEENLRSVDSWMKTMVNPYVVQGFVTSEHNNQSLPGLIYRLLTDSPSFVIYPNNQWTPDRYDNFLHLSTDVARWLVKGFMGLFVLFVIWTCRSPRGDPRRVAEYAIIVIGMLLFSERTWKHHCVTLLLPFAVLSYQLALWWERKALRTYLIGTMAVVVLLMSTTSISLLGRETGKMAQVYGAYVASFGVLLAALAVILRHSETVCCRSERRWECDHPPLSKAG